MRGYTLSQVGAFMAAIQRHEERQARSQLAAQAVSTAAGVSGGKAVEQLIKAVDRG